ncbi:MAG: hypothetical protein K2G35_08595 [Duncaniella sp.]|nr:hypothetical protein [Duncaniella sp.]
MTKPLTPAQTYAKNVVQALDAFIASDVHAEYSAANVAKLIMERPKTLRAALSAYLYKSQMKSLNRH